MPGKKKKNYCVICGEVIFNRKTHAKYCKKCAKKREAEWRTSYRKRRKKK